MDESDNSNMNSILAVTDGVGHIHCFLDGSYPIGVISIDLDAALHSLYKDPKDSVFYAHPQKSIDGVSLTDLHPTVIELPLLHSRSVRDMAKMSSTARELTWYTMRVVKEMRTVWFGSETSSGARELGPKWIRALETKQKDEFGGEHFLQFIYLLLIPPQRKSRTPSLT